METKSTKMKNGKQVVGWIAAVLLLMVYAAAIASAGGKVVVNGQINVSGSSYWGGNSLYVDQSAGNVGIGTTGPESKLTVYKNQAGDTLYENNAALLLKVASGNSQELRFGVDSSTLTSSIQSVQSGVDVKSLLLNPQGGDVGIGTAAPNEKLELGGGYSPALKFDYYSPDYPTSWYGKVADYGSSDGQDSLGGVQFLSHRGYADSTHAFYDFVTKTGTDASVSAMVITGGGNVGIGTTDPWESLHIQSAGSQLMLTDSNMHGASSQYALFDFDDTSDNSLNIKTGYSGGTGNIIGFSPGGTEKVRFQQNGKVGVGTTNPTETLTVNGNVSLNNTLYVLKNGNVGIGTTSPDDRLAVSGGNILLRESDNSDYTMRLGYDSSLLGLSNIYRMRLGGNSAPSGFAITDYDAAVRVFVNRLGSVGINTTSPNKALVVVGDENVTGNLYVSGQQVTVPDYVFDENYSLMPLSDLAAYVRENRHLPNMAGRNDTSQVDVVGQQQKLQEKIEELTLYVLELKEENDRLRDLVCTDHPGGGPCGISRPPPGVTQ